MCAQNSRVVAALVDFFLLQKILLQNITSFVFLAQLGEILNVGQENIRHFLIIGFLYVPAVSNDHEF